MNDTQMIGSNRPIFSEQERSAVRVAASKSLVYLDSCIWIELAERCQNLSQKCHSLVQSGHALFPISFSAVTEAIEQPTAAKRARVADLMDDLSGGLCFRPSKTIHDMEANLALPVVLGASEIIFPRAEILTWTAEFASKMTVQFPPSWKSADAAKFTRLLAASPELRSVRWLVDHSPPGQMRAENADRMERYVQEMAAAMARSRAQNQRLSKGARWKQLLLEERTSVVKKLISPRMNKNVLNIVGPEKLLDTVAALSKQVGEGGQQRLDQIMRAMPSLDLYCHIMAERGRNHTRKVRAQDFFDVEHAVVGGVYADFFVTSDRNLYDLLTQRCTISANRGCRVVRGVTGLEEAVKQVANGFTAR